MIPFVVAQVYGRRWGIETFFRWLKQHQRLRGFFSNSPNGVRILIWSALGAHLLVAIARQRKNLPVSLYEILQIVSASSLEQVLLQELFTKVNTSSPSFDIPKQLETNWS
ncbi:MAG: transposase [Opitutaceae bacterium]|nr:transposase [Opitutaceae bacterium]